MSVENTANRDPMLHALGLMSDGYIEGMEAAGQRQLVASEQIPVRGYDEAELEALGFELQPATARDPLFRDAKLPPGWTKARSDHSMWSYIVDHLGRRRAAVFYKAAFYDRDAFLSLYSQRRYLTEVLDKRGEPVLDDQWLPATVAVETLEEIRDGYNAQAVEADGFAERGNGEYWAERATENRAQAKRAEKLRNKVASS